MRRLVLFLFVTALAVPLVAQTATKKGPPPTAAATAQAPANLAQLMRGILYPASNVVFAAQSDDFAKIKPAKDPATATDPIQSTYGSWQAVENASLALVESASLLTVGRKCSNGVDAPVRNPDWAKFLQGLREAGMKSYQAAKAKVDSFAQEVALVRDGRERHLAAVATRVGGTDGPVEAMEEDREADRSRGRESRKAAGQLTREKGPHPGMGLAVWMAIVREETEIGRVGILKSDREFRPQPRKKADSLELLVKRMGRP